MFWRPYAVKSPCFLKLTLLETKKLQASCLSHLSWEIKWSWCANCRWHWCHPHWGSSCHLDCLSWLCCRCCIGKCRLHWLSNHPLHWRSHGLLWSSIRHLSGLGKNCLLRGSIRHLSGLGNNCLLRGSIHWWCSHGSHLRSSIYWR